MAFLTQRGLKAALVGHSFGGAVVITAAAASADVETVVTLSTQSGGTEDVSAIAPRPILIVHGTDDRVLPPSCSKDVYARAGEPRRLEIVEGVGHTLDEGAEQIYDLLLDWFDKHLPEVAPGPH